VAIEPVGWPPAGLLKEGKKAILASPAINCKAENWVYPCKWCPNYHICFPQKVVPAGLLKGGKEDTEHGAGVDSPD